MQSVAEGPRGSVVLVDFPQEWTTPDGFLKFTQERSSRFAVDLAARHLTRESILEVLERLNPDAQGSNKDYVDYVSGKLNEILATLT